MTPAPSRIALLFPVWAALLAVLAYAAPGMFTPWRGAIVPLLVVIMFGMGLTLKAADFARAIGRWRVVFLGLALQFGLMPLAAWVIANLLRLDAPVTLGLILVGSVAGGTASNVICFLAGGDVALSITLTSVSTLVSVVATPLLTWFYAGTHIPVPVLPMLASIAGIVLVPVLAGMLVGRLLALYSAGRWASRDGWCALVSAAAVGLVIAIVVALNTASIATLGAIVLLAVILHNGIGLAVGYAVTRVLTGDAIAARTVAIEVGMQNSGLAVALAQQYFSATAALPGAIFSVWHNLSGALLAAIFARRDRQSGRMPLRSEN